MSLPSFSPTLCGVLALMMFCFGSVLAVLCLKVLPPFELGAVIFVIGYVFMAVAQMACGKSLVSPWRHNLASYVGAVGGVGLYTVMIYAAFGMEPAFEVNVLNYLWPIFIVVFSMMLGRTPANFFQISGAVLGFVGMMCLFITPGHSFLMEGLRLGHILSIGAAAVWAAYSIWAKGQNYSSSFMGPVMLLSGLLCLGAHVLAERTVLPQTLDGLLLVFVLGAFRVSYVLWDIGMRKGDTLLLSSLSYFVPLASTVLMVAFGFKPEHAGIAFGGGLIILGCLVVNADKILKLFRKMVVSIP